MAPKRKREAGKGQKGKTQKTKAAKVEDEVKKVPEEAEALETKEKHQTADSKPKNGDKPWTKKIVSWNVDGVRAWAKKNGTSIFDKEDPDIICFQEIKCNETNLPNELKNKTDYHQFIFPAKKQGYSGVALFSKEKPLSLVKGIGQDVHDDEGRIITAEYDEFYLVTAYVPNAGRKLISLDKRMDWDEHLAKHLSTLDAKKHVVYCGDLNVAHEEVDLANPKSNKKNAGFTQEERDGFTKLLKDGPFVDSFRHFYPDLKHQYTFWTYMMNCRAKNVGWRLDYFVVSERVISKVSDNIILREELGSDHCPIMLLVDL